MARIPEAELDAIKRSVAIADLIAAKGVTLALRGQDLVGLCPFHDDKTPSLVATPSKNLWRCFACGIGGSVIDWVQRAEGVSFRHAVELLRADSPALRSDHIAAPTGSTVPKLVAPFDAEASDAELLSQVLDFYRETFKQNDEARAYLAKRGLDHPELAAHFSLGYANRTLGYRLPKKNRKEGQRLRSRLQELGILRASGHEHLRGCLVVSFFDAAGKVGELYGRRLGKVKNAGPHLYLRGPHGGVLNLPAFAEHDEIILCESALDAFTFWCAGFRNVTASFGCEGFTSELLGAFKGHKITRVLIAYDRDEAGNRAAAKLASRLLKEDIECARVELPKGMDVNAYACSTQPADKALALVLRNAREMGEPRATQANEPKLPKAKAASSSAADVVPVPLAVKATPSPAKPATQKPTGAADPAPTKPTPPLQAASISKGMSVEQVETRRGLELRLKRGDRSYAVRGIERIHSANSLKVTVFARRADAVHIDSLDLYASRQRSAFIREVASELALEQDVVKSDVSRALLCLEDIIEGRLEAEAEGTKKEEVELSEEERAEALALLRDPNLIARVLEDFERCGVIGEETNKLVGYLAVISRKLPAPLAVVIQSSSAAGKSSLMEAVLSLVPREDQVKYSAMTGQSLFYMGERDLKHKVLAIVEEEGASSASYALKLLQSEGELTIASTGKNPKTGRLETQEYRVEGPVMLFLTTTAVELDEELLNRCLVLTVDEDRAQTRAIHRAQRFRRTLAGRRAFRLRKSLLDLHRNAQRLLRPIEVVNPYADLLTFMDDRTRTRRDHNKYLTLIETVTLLRQHQRELKDDQGVEFIEVTPEDIATANELARTIFARTLDDMPPQTRRFLTLLDAMVRETAKRLELDRGDVRFARRDVREFTRWSPSQVRKHMDRLVDLEYVIAHRGTRGQSFLYELLYERDGEEERFVIRLLDAANLVRRSISSTPSEPSLTPSEGGIDPQLTPHCPPDDPLLTPTPIGLDPSNGKASSRFRSIEPKNAHVDAPALSHSRNGNPASKSRA